MNHIVHHHIFAAQLCPAGGSWWIIVAIVPACARPSSDLLQSQHHESSPPMQRRFQMFQHGACHWIGLREKLQQTMVFTIKYRAFRLKFSHNPILLTWHLTITIHHPLMAPFHQLPWHRMAPCRMFEALALPGRGRSQITC